jgi:hypothetical protein
MQDAKQSDFYLVPVPGAGVGQAQSAEIGALKSAKIPQDSGI